MKMCVIDENDAGERLDQYVADRVTELSRSVAQKLIKQGNITVNDQLQRPSYQLRTGDQLSLPEETDLNATIPDVDIPILYEDDDCLVVDKPTGLLTHSKGMFNPEATVATFVQRRSPYVDGERSGIVHRLDRATSGVMICAKTTEALSWLQKQFSKRNVKKMYVAVIDGALDPEHAIIDMPIERNPKKPQTFRVGSNGKSAITEYKVTRTNRRRSLVELFPTTGRTHQLRVHLAQLGHPIIGDTLYSGSPSDRLYLHASRLEITLPSKKRMVFESKLPNEFLEKVDE